MEELKNLIVFFIRNFPRSLSRTELIKLIYLFEYHHVQIYGKQYSNVEFIRYKHGPFATEILNEAGYLAHKKAILCNATWSFNFNRIYLYSINDEDAASAFLMPERECNLALSLINDVKDFNCKMLMDLAYSTPPMATIIRKEKEDEIRMDGGKINMAEAKKTKKFTKEQLAAAKERIHAVADRGADEEYYAHSVQLYEEYANLRRRANLCR